MQVVEQELPEEDRVTIRLKFLNETQKEVEASLVENLGQFKRRNFTEEIGNNKNVRLIFNGQVPHSYLIVISMLQPFCHNAYLSAGSSR